VHDSEDAIVSEIRILHQLSEWKYVVPLLLKALSIDSCGEGMCKETGQGTSTHFLVFQLF
jgi:hypothetical protein